MSVHTRETWAYWLSAVNVSGILGQKSISQISQAFGPDGTFDTTVPGFPEWDDTLHSYGTFTQENIHVPAMADVQLANQNTEGVTEFHTYVIYIDETETDLYVSLNSNLPYDPNNPKDFWITPNVHVTRSPRMVDETLDFAVGSFMLFNDPREDTENDTPFANEDLFPVRRYETFQIVSKVGDVWTIKRHDDINPYDQASFFGGGMNSHLAGCKAYLLKFQHFSWKFAFNPALLPVDDPLIPRVDGVWPSTCIVATRSALVNYYGFSDWTTRVMAVGFGAGDPLPGHRTLNGAAYVFRQDGDLVVSADAGIPQQIHDWASIRCIYATVNLPSSGSDIVLTVKYRYTPTDSWQVIQTLTIPDGQVTSYPSNDTPTERRMPYLEGYNKLNPIYGPEVWPPPVLKGDAQIGYDILQIGSGLPGTGLMLYVQT